MDFINASSIKYALTVNPNIYVSVIKQFWSSVAVKKVNDVSRLQALIDRKKVIITEATIRDALCLDDAEGKGCSGVETPLFKGLIVAQQVSEGAVEVNVEDVFTAGVAAEGAASAADDEVPAIDARISMDILQNLLDTCTTLTRRVEHLEQDKIAQALGITKLKQRVKKLERRNKASKLRRLKRVGTAQRVETFDDTVMDDVSKQGRIIADMDVDEDVTLKDVDAIAKDVQDAEIEEITAVSTTITVAAPQLTAAASTLTTAPSAARRRKGVVIRDPEESATPSTIIHTEAKSKDKRKRIMVEEPKPLKKQA
nr:hypothetical protein [Tanacetum cinerariifolium]